MGERHGVASSESNFGEFHLQVYGLRERRQLFIRESDPKLAKLAHAVGVHDSFFETIGIITASVLLLGNINGRIIIVGLRSFLQRPGSPEQPSDFLAVASDCLLPSDGHHLVVRFHDGLSAAVAVSPGRPWMRALAALFLEAWMIRHDRPGNERGILHALGWSCAQGAGVLRRLAWICSAGLRCRRASGPLPIILQRTWRLNGEGCAAHRIHLDLVILIIDFRI